MTALPILALALLEQPAKLPWGIPLAAFGVVVIAVGLVIHQRTGFQRRTRRLMRELYNVMGKSDPGDMRSSKEVDSAWSGLVGQMQDFRQSQVKARSLDALGSLMNNENERMRGVFKALPLGILVLRNSTRVVYANRLAADLLGITGDEEEPLIENAGGSVQVIAILRTILSGDLARGIRTERFEVTGEDEDTQVYRVRLLGGGASKDLLERENLQIVTFENITTEESTQRMRTEFVYGVSHELKTPLTSIQASLEMLVEEEDLEEDDRKRLIDLSYSEALRLGRMVRELLDLARVEAGVTEVRRERVVVADLMDELQSVHMPLAKRKSIDMQWNVSDFVPTVIGDRDLLLQAFVNLIGNAVKYTRESGQVSVTVGIEGEELVICVQDNGIGIPEQDLDKIFDKFFRAGSAKKTSIPGTGLGLPMARFIVETHGGRIDVSSVEGEGSTFTIYMPSDNTSGDELETTGLQSMESMS